MHITVQAHLKDVLDGLGTMGQRQAPFAARWAINAVTRDAERVVRYEVLPRRFTTSPQGLKFLQRHVKVLGPNSKLGRAHLTPGRDMQLRAVLGIIPPGSKGQGAGFENYRGSLLPMMEEGGPTPGPRNFGGRAGLGRYAIPINRPGARPRMPLTLWPINLRLQSRRTIAGPLSIARLQGKRRTYLIQLRTGESMIFQRYGRERDATMPIFATKQATRLPARRYFMSTVEWVVRTRMRLHAERALQHALFNRGAYRG